jgi:hypothetical protein
MQGIIESFREFMVGMGILSPKSTHIFFFFAHVYVIPSAFSKHNTYISHTSVTLVLCLQPGVTTTLVATVYALSQQNCKQRLALEQFSTKT